MIIQVPRYGQEIHIPACQFFLANSDSRITLDTHFPQVLLSQSQAALILIVRGSGYPRTQGYDALGVVEEVLYVSRVNTIASQVPFWLQRCQYGAAGIATHGAESADRIIGVTEEVKIMRQK